MEGIPTTYYSKDMILDNQNFDFKISKAKIIEDIMDLKRKGAKIEIKPNSITDYLNRKINKVEYWLNALGRQKIILIIEKGYKVIVEEPKKSTNSSAVD
ncbi:hypothetical protein JCM16358_12330 [Halanaerocella petrolearia]